MAKKQQGTGKKASAQPQKTDQIITNTFVKGMVKDTDASYFDKQSWYHARNLINNSVDGDLGVVGNEPANLRCAKIPYTIIGGIHLYGDVWTIFSTNDNLSEIGLFDDSKCEYTTLVNDQCLNFNQDNLIIGASKENFDCTWQVYWDDGLNPSRTLNINNIPWVQIVDPDTPAGSTCVTYVDAEPKKLDCERIRLAPLIDVPCVTLNKADQGGLLENGSYQVYVAYCINDKPVTDYIGISNIQPIWSHEDTQGSMTIKLSNLDKEFDQISVVIRSRVKGQPENRELGIYSTETEEINVDYINKESQSVLSSVLQRRIPTYEKSDGIFVVNDYLIRSQPTEQFDFNYQPLANNIDTYWTATQYPDTYYSNGGNKPTLLRDEQYAFFIRFIYNTGERSKSYHIPGRAPNPNEILPAGAPNNVDASDPLFKAQNTATSDPGNVFISTLIGTTSDDGGTIIDGGQMGYWQSTEVYDPTNPVRWGNLCGQPIRHHKIPDESIGSPGSFLTSPGGDNLNVIGVAFDNIAAPVDNNGDIIPNIVGYEILVGGRAGHRSILAKGIIKNMFRFRRNQNDGTQNSAGAQDNFATGTGLLPNYPFNDLRTDPYLIGRNSNNQTTLPWYAQFNTAPEENWQRGNMSQADGRGFNTIDATHYTFHSPELNFSKLYLNPSEIKVYKTILGEVRGRFKKSEDHPRAKLLKNRAATVAALIGVGYALAEMRGKRDYKVDTMRSHSVGEFGAYALGSGSHGSPVVGPGTGLAAANIGASSGSIWLGAAADTAFNAGVDIAAIFGAGKLARTIGTPIYQQVEVGSTALAAGHIGPKRSIKYNGSDFTAVPTIMSIAIGIISFLNYVAVGGDKIIDLILNLIGYQDYAMKYISHGYYNNEMQYQPAQYRIGINRARYIKSALQSFNANTFIYNQMRPSTVVFETVSGWGSSWPLTGNGAPMEDNTKFTIGAGGCAGDGVHSMSWYNPGEEVRSTAVANYGAFKTPMDNQYGQLDQIIQLNTQGCYYFRTQQATDEDGNLVPIQPMDRFSTNTVYAGDSYIARYTEKAIMPFFFTFLKAGEDGIPFDYSKYANVPFPRFWMNTEKFRMDQFVRPITNLSFNWSNSEALPSGYYNMDCPENGGYCGAGNLGDGLGAIFGEGQIAGSTVQSGEVTGSGGVQGLNTSGIQNPTALGGAAFTDINDQWNIDNGNAAFNNRFQVVQISASSASGSFNVGGGDEVPYQLQVKTSNPRWKLVGAGGSEIAMIPPAAISSLVDTVYMYAQFNITLSDHGYSTPFDVEGNGPCATLGNNLSAICDCSSGYINFTDWLRESRDDDEPIPNSYNGLGSASCRVIWDWSTGTFVGMTTAAIGMYASNSTTITTGGTGEISDLILSDSLIFSSQTAYRKIGSTSMCPNNTRLDAGTFAYDFSATPTPGPGSIQSQLKSAVQAGGPGNMDSVVSDAEDAAQDSLYAQGNNSVGSGGATGGLFVIKTGYMYTHNCGINDFWVESSMNLAYRDWEDVDRKRHYDADEYTDLVELFHAKIINFDNYYFYDRSTAVDKFWGSSWGQIQESYYNPLIAETCWIKYPKRLLYSVPATGFKDKAQLQNKNDAKQDFWRVYLTENFRDFKSKVTAIKPINETGALIFFPTMSPKMFAGQDRLKLTNTKLTIGDGGLFSQAFQNITNSDVSHEYGSCESSRSILNTPSGVYFVSQAQGKIFNYKPGGGLTPISDQGMKWWMNKFLPSKLLEYFPLMEDCPQAIDNPVNGAGVQTVYDPNNDIVYFCKKDYKPLPQFEPCIQYIPCEGFVYNATICEGVSQVASCPTGYTYNPSTQMCELQTIEPAHSYPVEECQADIIFVIDSSNSIQSNGNRVNARNFVNGIINGLIANTNPGELRFGMVHFGAGRNTASNLHGYNATGTNDTMFNDNDQLALTDDISQPAAWLTNRYDAACLDTDTPSGTDMIGGVWAGMNLLYGSNSRPSADKRLIIITDGPHYTQGTSGGTYTAANDRHINAGTPSPAPPDVSIGNFDDATSHVYVASSNATDYMQNNIIGHANFPNQKTFIIGLDASQPPGTTPSPDTPNANQQAYFNLWADPNTSTEQYAHYGSYSDPAQVESIVNSVIGNICPDPVYYCVNTSCVLDNSTDPPGCICSDSVPPTWEDITYPIEVDNEQYFKDISWTISYDPKAKAWLSFHDWHPELTFNSIRHFLTSKSEMTNVPQCPPGYTWNGDECCLALHHEELAEVNVEEFQATETITDATVESFTETMDIVCVIDFSTSMKWSRIEAAMQFVSTFVTGMSPGMLGGPYAGQVRIGHGRWGSGSSSNSPGDPAQIVGLTDDPAIAGGSLDETNTAQYYPDSGTDYNDAIDLANTMLSGSTADQRIVLFITDAGAAPSNPTDLTNATQLFAIKVDSASTADTCSLTSGYGDDLKSMITDTNLPSSPAYDVPRCANDGSLPRNLYHIGSNVPVGQEGHASTVAANIVAAFTNCTCTQGVIDTWSGNPPCLPLPEPPPQCISCECPDGYTMVGTCNDSSNLPVCRKMHCECTSPYFNPDEILTQTGFCDDIFLWYNPVSGVGDPSYVNDDPLYCVYDYQDCVAANYELGYFWKHNSRTDLFNNYYEKNYPWEVDIIEQTGQQVTTLRSIEYQMEAYLYQNEGKDRFHDLDYNFDEAIIYNSEQVSGLLRLVLEPKNNIQLSMMYPIVGANDIQTLFSKVEQKYRFNQFWDITNDRGEFSAATNTIWLTDWDGYDRTLNPANLNYNKPQQQRKKFRHYFNHVLLRKSADMATTRKMLLKLENTKLNMSFR